MEPAEFSRISFESKIDFEGRVWAVDKNLDQLLVTSQMQPDNRALFLSKAPFTPAWTWPARCVHLGVSLKVNSTLGRTLLCLGSHRPRASTYKKIKKSWERLRDFKYLAPKKDLSEQFFVICGQTSWSSALKNLHYLDHTSAYVYAKGHYCNFKTVGVDAWQKPKMPAILYIYG